LTIPKILSGNDRSWYKGDGSTSGRGEYLMSEYTIMIVDDEPDILNLLEKALNMEGFYNIVKTDNGICAVNICEQNPPV